MTESDINVLNSAIPDGDFLPSDWKQVLLGDVTTKKITDGTHKTPVYVDKGIPFITATNINNNRIDFSDCKFITENEHAFLIKRCKPEFGDVLLSKVGTLGLVAKVTINFEFSIFVQVALIKPNRSLIDSGYLEYVLSAPPLQNEINLKASQSTMKYIGVGKIAQLEIPLPPLPEQQSIAHILQTVREAKEKTDEVIRATKELKKSMMKHLFTYGPVSLEEAEKVKLKETEIGMMPEKWIVLSLNDLINIKHGYAFKGEFFGDEGPILLTPGNFTEHGGLYFNDRNLKRYSGDFPKEFILSSNDLVIVMTDLSPFCKILGNPAFIPDGETILHNQRIGKIIFKVDKINPKYLYYFLLLKEVKQIIKSTATGSTVRHTAPSRILNINIPLPRLPIQQQISDILSSIDTKIEAEENKRKSLEALFKTLLRDLMTAKRRVNNLSVEELAHA